MDKKKGVLATLALLSQLGLGFIVPILLCVWLGVKLDERFGTSLTVWLIIIGVLAGARNAYVLVCRTKEVMDDEEKE